MSIPDWLPCDSSLGDYQRQADALFDALKSGGEEARWRFTWEHPRFHGRSVTEVNAATLEVGDAQLVTAHRYGFETWADLCSAASKRAMALSRFGASVNLTRPCLITGQRSLGPVQIGNRH